MDKFLFAVGNVELIGLTLAFWAFILVFHVLADWRASEMGKHMMSFMGVCAIILTWGCVTLFVDTPITFRLASRIPLYGVLGWVVWKRIRILIKTQVISRGTANEIMEGRNATNT